MMTTLEMDAFMISLKWLSNPVYICDTKELYVWRAEAAYHFQPIHWISYWTVQRGYSSNSAPNSFDLSSQSLWCNSVTNSSQHFSMFIKLGLLDLLSLKYVQNSIIYIQINAIVLIEICLFILLSFHTLLLKK